MAPAIKKTQASSYLQKIKTLKLKLVSVGSILGLWIYIQFVWIIYLSQRSIPDKKKVNLIFPLKFCITLEFTDLNNHYKVEINLSNVSFVGGGEVSTF